MARNSLKNVMHLIDVANQNIPVEQMFLSDLKRSIEITDEKESRPPSKTYKPSSMNCERQMYYQVIGAEQDKGNSNYCLVGICESGTDRHVRIQNAVMNMKANGMDCEYIDVAEFVKSRNLDYLDVVGKNADNTETKLYHKGLNMSFLCDGIIKYKGKYYIIEFKTESIYKWASRQGVNPDHYNQAISYSIAFGIDEVLFVYINRDNTDMKTYIYKVTDDMKQELVGRIDYVDSYVNKMKTPPKPEKPNKKACTYCNYKTLCGRE